MRDDDLEVMEALERRAYEYNQKWTAAKAEVERLEEANKRLWEELERLRAQVKALHNVLYYTYCMAQEGLRAFHNVLYYTYCFLTWPATFIPRGRGATTPFSYNFSYKSRLFVTLL